MTPDEIYHSIADPATEAFQAGCRESQKQLEAALRAIPSDDVYSAEEAKAAWEARADIQSVQLCGPCVEELTSVFLNGAK